MCNFYQFLYVSNDLLDVYVSLTPTEVQDLVDVLVLPYLSK
jgi:hypothetical protein